MSKKEIEPRIDTYCEQQQQTKVLLAGDGINFDYDDKNNMFIRATAKPVELTGTNGVVVEGSTIGLDEKFIVDDESTATNVLTPVTAGENIEIIKEGTQYKINGKAGGSTSVDGLSITKNGQYQVQAVGLMNDSELMTAEAIYLACTIERTV